MRTNHNEQIKEYNKDVNKARMSKKAVMNSYRKTGKKKNSGAGRKTDVKKEKRDEKSKTE